MPRAGIRWFHVRRLLQDPTAGIATNDRGVAAVVTALRPGRIRAVTALSHKIPDLDEELKMQLEDVVELIRMEYAELPGLKLTVCQARRLWSVSTDLCTTALETLIRCQFLERTTDGSYVRRWPDDSPAWQQRI